MPLPARTTPSAKRTTGALTLNILHPRRDAMLDKALEQSRAKSVTRRFPAALADLGFKKHRGASCICIVDGDTWHVWLQKFRHQPAFRVAMSFTPHGSEKARVEFADKWTHLDSPAGRKFDFRIRWGDDAAERCLREIHDFVQVVAVPWFKSQADAAKRA
jgi:hypothetical protein